MMAAVYARYSSSLQRPTSIEDQLALCRQAAPRFGLNLLDEHIYTDVERSGATTHRPGYQQLLEAARRGAFRAIVVEAQDRLWRDQGELHGALKRLRFLGIRVFSVETGTDLTETAGHLLASFKGVMDEHYLESLREKTRRGMLGQVRRGMSPGGHPYGYRSEPTGMGSRRVVAPEKALMVVRIFELYAAGHSPKEIVKQLNREGIKPPFWREGKPNRGWTPSTINGQRSLALGILNNPIYIGQQVWNRVRKVTEPDTGRRVWRRQPKAEWVTASLPELRIVSDELWQAVQARREALGHRWSRGCAPPRYLLSGLLVCGACGAAYSIVGGSGKYGCTGHYYRGVCGNKVLVKRAVLEEWIIGLVRDRLLSPDQLALLVARVEEGWRRRATAPPDPGPLRAAEAEVGRLLEAVRLGRGEIPELVKMIEETKARVDFLRRERDRSREPVDLRLLPDLARRYVEKLGVLVQTDVARAREMLRRVLEPIRIEPRESGAVVVVRGDLSGMLPVGLAGAGGRT